MYNLSQETRQKLLDAGQAAGTSTVDSASYDTSGINAIMFNGGFGTANAGNTVHLQHSDDDSVWNDMEGTQIVPTVNGNLWIIDIKRPLKRYIRVRQTRGVSTTTYIVIATGYQAIKMATTHDATVAPVLVLASPETGTP